MLSHEVIQSLIAILFFSAIIVWRAHIARNLSTNRRVAILISDISFAIFLICTGVGTDPTFIRPYGLPKGGSPRFLPGWDVLALFSIFTCLGAQMYLRKKG